MVVQHVLILCRSHVKEISEVLSREKLLTDTLLPSALLLQQIRTVLHWVWLPTQVVPLPPFEGEQQ